MILHLSSQFFRWVTSIDHTIMKISGQCEGDNERLYAVEPCLCLDRFLHSVGLKPRTAGSANQPFSYCAMTGAPHGPLGILQAQNKTDLNSMQAS